MSTFPRSTSKWNDAPCGVDRPGTRTARINLAARCAVVGATMVWALAPVGRAQNPTGGLKKLVPFLEEFKSRKEPATLTSDVSIATALGRVTGLLARPSTEEKLPAILLLHGEAGLTPWMKQNAMELSSIGYVVLALDLRHRVQTVPQEAVLQDEKTLAEASAAVRWLRRRPDVLPEQLGVAGWSWGGGLALALASATPLQACVVCDRGVAPDPAMLAGLRGTAVLGIFTASEEKVVPAFRKALQEARLPHKIFTFPAVRSGFMGPPADKHYSESEAEQAWFEIYEFLGKYVEDAAPSVPAAAATPIATIADIMRAVNQPTGVRGALIEALKKNPTSKDDWDRIHAQAALLAEAGDLLSRLKPHKGTHAHWREHTRTYQRTAVRIVDAAGRHDYPASRRALDDLGGQCAACHRRHR
jgi:dienelactone hydrolase